MQISPELLELAELHDARRLSDFGELRPFYFQDAFFTARNGFDDYLFQAQEFGWPVFYLSHFAGLHPIGASGGGDHWLARVTPDAGGTSRVYKYDHETGELDLVFMSIAALVRAAQDRVDMDGLRTRGARLASTDDPVALWERATWAAAFVGAGALDSWMTSLDRAANLATFAKETKLLGKRPDLTAYWLLAHALLGSPEAFATADRVAQKSKNPFLIALRPRARRLLEPDSLDDLALRKLTGADVARRLAELRKRAPKPLRKGTPPPLPETPPEITIAMVTKLAKKGELLAFMAQHPANERLHVWALENIKLWSSNDRGDVAVVERIADHGLTSKRLKEMTTWLTISPLVADSGQREAQLLALLVARRSQRAAEIVLRTLKLLEKTWTRIELAAETARLAAALDGTAARPILERMIADKTWQTYTSGAMPHFRSALESIR